MFQRNAAARLALTVLCTFALNAHADTLGQIRKSGEIRLGYRTDAPPMSFTEANARRRATRSSSAAASPPP